MHVVARMGLQSGPVFYSFYPTIGITLVLLLVTELAQAWGLIHNFEYY